MGYFPNIEDLMNWHGKALGDKSAEVVAHVESLMKNPAVKPSSIAPPVLDCPPSDIKGVACERAVELSANQRGICFVRVSRPATAVIYENNERFDIGKAKVVRKSDSDKVLVVAAGVTLYEALKAADVLASKGVNIRVIDPFTIKPIDIAAIRENAAACGGRILTVEDHYPEGGIGDAVLDAVADLRNVVVKKLAVNAVPRSGPPMELLEMFGISVNCIVKAVNELASL